MRETFQISGITCKSCKILIESEIGRLDGVRKIDVDYKSGQCFVDYDQGKISLKKIQEKIRSLDYEIKEDNGISRDGDAKNEGVSSHVSTNQVLIGALLLVLFAILYIFVKQSGAFQLLSKLNNPNIGYGLIFLIGLLASFHCVGMCGGLVVSYSLKRDKGLPGTWNRFLPHLQYNSGRLLSYTITGAILGGIGSFFAVSPTFTGVVTILAALMMVITGASLLSGGKLAEKVRLKMPSFLAKYLFGLWNSNRAPFVIGLLNGLMPCGPLQAMQFYALSSGSALKGGLSMAVFSLGTIPMMFGLGNLVSSMGKEKLGHFFKYAGAVVIVLGILTFNRGLANFRINQSIAGSIDGNNAVAQKGSYQEARMSLTARGYEPNTLFIKAGVPVRWIIDVKQMSGCTNEIILQGYNIRKKLTYGENIIEFTPGKAGEINFSCWMQMVWGKFVVTDDGSKPANFQSTTLSVPSSGKSCGGKCGCCGSRIQ